MPLFLSDFYISLSTNPLSCYLFNHVDEFSAFYAIFTRARVIQLFAWTQSNSDIARTRVAWSIRCVPSDFFLPWATGKVCHQDPKKNTSGAFCRTDLNRLPRLNRKIWSRLLIFHIITLQVEDFQYRWCSTACRALASALNARHPHLTLWRPSAASIFVKRIDLVHGISSLLRCRIPDDCIDQNRSSLYHRQPWGNRRVQCCQPLEWLWR